ncbi:hypothetical protein [Aquimarina sediminis]|uniref:hypothetical protein n=1 Tax=Aquimarina sediminis TaxID=2070536 RepID=UPI0013E8C845|nr:hypothetical protein [Aquimarina sediminis]
MKNINGTSILSIGSIISVIGIILLTLKVSSILYMTAFALGLLLMVVGVILKAKKK